MFFFFDVPLAVPFWCSFLCSSQYYKVSSLYTHTDIIGNNNATKHAFLRVKRMDKVGSSCPSAVSEGGRGCEAPLSIPGGLEWDFKSVQISKKRKRKICVLITFVWLITLEFVTDRFREEKHCSVLHSLSPSSCSWEHSLCGNHSNQLSWRRKENGA